MLELSAIGFTNYDFVSIPNIYLTLWDAQFNGKINSLLYRVSSDKNVAGTKPCCRLLVVYNLAR